MMTVDGIDRHCPVLSCLVAERKGEERRGKWEKVEQPFSKISTKFSLDVKNNRGGAGRGQGQGMNLSHDTKFSGANRDRGKKQTNSFLGDHEQD